MLDTLTKAPKAASTHLRFDMDPGIVAHSVDHRAAHFERQRLELKAQAEKTLASYETEKAAGRTWHGRVPEGSGCVDPMIDGWIAKEKNHYARVRVVERLEKTDNRFFLVYGDDADAGPGGSRGFTSLGAAQTWFAGHGR